MASEKNEGAARLGKKEFTGSRKANKVYSGARKCNLGVGSLHLFSLPTVILPLATTSQDINPRVA